MTDEELEQAVRAAIPPASYGEPTSDQWPHLADLLDARPRWGWTDLGLAAALGAVLLIFPKWLSILLFHL